MLNYIWAGLIIISLLFALVHDFRDTANDTYRNGQPLPVEIGFPAGYQESNRLVPVTIRVDPAEYSRFYDTDAQPDSLYEGIMVQTQRTRILRFAADADLPEPLATIHEFSASRDDELQGDFGNVRFSPDSSMAVGGVTFERVRFVKMHAIAAAAFDFAETAATLALSLIGVLALFLGLLRIAEASGIINALVRFTQPIFRPLFPEIPDGHPALGMIVLNLTANMLGLGNAATPLGLKAMEELQKLNPVKDTATNSMVMLLALNTASVQLVPPTLLVAVMGVGVNELILPIIVVTLASSIVAIVSARLLQRSRRNRASDPMLAGASPASPTPETSDEV